jgi:hypothetical protein
MNRKDEHSPYQTSKTAPVVKNTMIPYQISKETWGTSPFLNIRFLENLSKCMISSWKTTDFNK